jgi:flagellar biosynthesis anti-sigma factor FlgM
MALTESDTATADNVTDLAEARRTKAAGTTRDKTAAPAKAAEHGNRRFDKEKVERIKAEIANGSYEIDPLRVADKFIEYDRK